MTDQDESASQPDLAASDNSRWPVYLLITLLSGGVGYISLIAAAFSINMTVVVISIGTSITCLVIALILAYRRRGGYAFLLVMANIPIAFGLAVSYFYVRPIAQDILKEMQRIVSPAKPPPTQVVLDQSLRNGAIRKATQEDAKAWLGTYVEKCPPRELSPQGQHTKWLSGILEKELSNTYIVLNRFTYPSDMTYENRTIFIIPKGVPKPNGKLGNSLAFHFEPPHVEWPESADSTSCY